MSGDGTLADYIAQHPKMSGILFTVLLLLTQVGNVYAAGGSANPGP